MKVPVTLRIAALAIATTGFYTYVGQLVPQKEVQPPVEVVMSKDMKPEEMAKVGLEIMENKGLCFTCHTVGKSGALRFPDLAGIGSRAGSRIPGLSGVEYMAESMYDPGKYIVPGFNPGMPVISKPPIGLTDDEILAVIAYLETLGGTTTVTMETKLPWQAGGTGAVTASGPPTEAGGPADAVPGFNEEEGKAAEAAGPSDAEPDAPPPAPQAPPTPPGPGQ
jgi:Cytochrome c